MAIQRPGVPGCCRRFAQALCSALIIDALLCRVKMKNLVVSRKRGNAHTSFVLDALTTTHVRGRGRCGCKFPRHVSLYPMEDEEQATCRNAPEELVSWYYKELQPLFVLVRQHVSPAIVTFAVWPHTLYASLPRTPIGQVRIPYVCNSDTGRPTAKGEGREEKTVAKLGISLLPSPLSPQSDSTTV